ncbi:MAG: hypothetical protein ABSG17_17945 [Spirochaetia bacterium]|jgi:hypothetical protein
MAILVMKAVTDALSKEQRYGMGRIIDLAEQMQEARVIGYDGKRFRVSKAVDAVLDPEQREGLKNIVALFDQMAGAGQIAWKELGVGPSLDERQQALRMGHLPPNDDPGATRATGLNETEDHMPAGAERDWWSDVPDSTNILPDQGKGYGGDGDARRSLTPEEEAHRQKAARILAVIDGGFQTADRQNRRDFLPPGQEGRTRTVGKSSGGRPYYSHPYDDFEHERGLRALAQEVAKELGAQAPPNLDALAASNAETVHRAVRGIMRGFFAEGRRPE